MVVHFKNFCNTYGSLAAYIVAFLVRLTGGEPILGLPAFIEYPGYDAENGKQLFPFRTMAMVMSLVTLIFVSWWTKWIFETGRLAPKYDYFRCVVNIPGDLIRVDEPSEVGEQMSVMTGPMQKMYGAAAMVGKDEMNGRINPAMEEDEDDLPIIEAQRKKSMQRAAKNPFRGEAAMVVGSEEKGGLMGGASSASGVQHGNTAF